MVLVYELANSRASIPALPTIRLIQKQCLLLEALGAGMYQTQMVWIWCIWSNRLRFRFAPCLRRGEERREEK